MFEICVYMTYNGVYSSKNLDIILKKLCTQRFVSTLYGYMSILSCFQNTIHVFVFFSLSFSLPLNVSMASMSSSHSKNVPFLICV